MFSLSGEPSISFLLFVINLALYVGEEYIVKGGLVRWTFPVCDHSLCDANADSEECRDLLDARRSSCVYGVVRNALPFITRRLDAEERRAIVPGNVYFTLGGTRRQHRVHGH